MEDPGAYTFIIAGQKPPGLLIQHDETGTVRSPDLAVGVVDAIARVDIQEVPINQDRAMGGIVWVRACLTGYVKQPEDFRVRRR